MVQYCVTASIKEGHCREVGDVQWLPHTIEICHKTGGIVENKKHHCYQLISCSIDGYDLILMVTIAIFKDFKYVPFCNLICV